MIDALFQCRPRELHLEHLFFVSFRHFLLTNLLRFILLLLLSILVLLGLSVELLPELKNFHPVSLQ